MLKKRVLALGGMIAVVLVVSVVALGLGILPRGGAKLSFAANAAATNTRVSGITVQNQSAAATANVTIDFFQQDGTKLSAATITAQIAPGGQRTWYSPNIAGLPAGFMGSAVVTSDQPVTANVNTQTPSEIGTDPFDPARVGTSSGVITPSTKVYVTQILRNVAGWNSTVFVQNAGAAAANVTFTPINAAGVSGTAIPATIAASAMKEFRQIDEPLGDNFNGSAVIESTNGQPLAVVVNFFNSGLDASTAQFHSYNGMGSGGTKLYAPRIVKNYFGYNSGLKIQNIDPTGDAVVTVTYFIGNSQVQQTHVIKTNQSAGAYLGAANQVPANLPDGTGSATIVSTNGKQILATINEDNRSLGRGVTYNAFVDGSQTSNILLPQVTSRYFGYSSGIQFQNVGAAAASGNIVLKMAGRNDISIPFSVAPNQSFSYFAPNAQGGTLTGFNGSAVITSNQPIVGIANLSFRFDVDQSQLEKFGDTFTTYNGLNN
jgi:hypothetical protein